ncbi:MAG: hypothetical protein M3072_11090 [Candidatus Dormibacteraeota bacterium]|nr:hypothetical protein [Candidatus Dormibacteraeota bacterium]
MADQLGQLPDAALKQRIEGLMAQMRPLEEELGRLRAERDGCLVELRRRDRLRSMERRKSVKLDMRAGNSVSLEALIAAAAEGSFDDYRFNLKTGGEVRLGFPGARQQTIAFTDGKQIVQARDFQQAADLFAAGWELGGPGRPGVRVHFPGTRQERLSPAGDVFATGARVAQDTSDGVA